MFRELWDKLSTRILPDRASLTPIVDFDAQTGSLSICFEADSGGRKVTLDRSGLQRSCGFIGDRKFKSGGRKFALLKRYLPQVNGKMAPRSKSRKLKFQIVSNG
jgi:hypothetical protein